MSLIDFLFESFLGSIKQSI